MMWFFFWIVANFCALWAFGSWTDKKIAEGTADPIGQSFAALGGLALLNVAILIGVFLI